MNCADLEILICDYVDGTLDAGRKVEVEHHLAQCPACAELAGDAAAAVAFMDRAADVEPPPELLTRILFNPPWTQSRPRAGAGLWNRFRALWQPVLQPRFAMGMAMTILSIAMLAKYVKPAHQLTARDLDPVAVWTSLDDRVYRAWQRSVKFYESMRVVYQIQSTLLEWQQQQDMNAAGEPEQTDRKADERRLPIRSPETKN